MSLNRRAFLQFGLAASAAMAGVSVTASLTGCSQPIEVTSGFRLFRQKDIVIFSKVAEATLNLDDAEVIRKVVLGIDHFLLHTSRPNQAKLQQLMDLLDFAPTRLLLTGWTHGWESATREEVVAVLEKWRSSRLEVLRLCYGTLVSACSSLFYMLPDNHAASGYPGPPKHDVSPVGV